MKIRRLSAHSSANAIGPSRSTACLVVALGISLASACAPTDPSEDSQVTVKRIDGAPVDASPPDKVPVAIPAGVPSVLSSIHGAVALGTETDLWAGSLADSSLTHVPVIADQPGEPETTGTIERLARRSGGRILVLGENGIFHDDQGILLSSPLNTDPALAGKDLIAVDAFGSDDAEELWICTTGGAFHVAAGKIAGFGITDPTGAAAALDAAIGVAPGQALVLSGDRAFFVDLKTNNAKSVVSGLGKVHGYDKAEDGTVYLATESGLWTREKTKDEVTVRSFAPAGSPPEPVLSVAASYGTVIVATGTSLIQIDGGEAKRLGDLATSPHGLAVDGNGDAWTIDAGALFHLKTGTPASFVNHVKPFFEGHCNKCHATGANGTPLIDLVSYDVAKEYASIIMKRLQGEFSVMPPASSEVLTAADYAVVTRWVAGGFLP